jgi:hypothetical protein
LSTGARWLILIADVQLHTQHHLIRRVEKVQQPNDASVFDAQEDVHLIRQHFRLVFDQRLVNNLDCTTFLSFLVDSKLDRREVTTAYGRERSKSAKEAKPEGVHE